MGKSQFLVIVKLDFYVSISILLKNNSKFRIFFHSAICSLSTMYHLFAIIRMLPKSRQHEQKNTKLII